MPDALPVAMETAFQHARIPLAHRAEHQPARTDVQTTAEVQAAQGNAIHPVLQAAIRTAREVLPLPPNAPPDAERTATTITLYCMNDYSQGVCKNRHFQSKNGREGQF